MTILITGATGAIGSALVPRLSRDGHDVRALVRDSARAHLPGTPIFEGDVVSGRGLAAALDEVEVAYFLVHSMEAGGADGGFADRERRSASTFAEAAERAGVDKVVYLGGMVPADGRSSPHLASRLKVEETLLAASKRSVALRASIVISARSRSFRFMVRLIERLPFLALPAWRDNRTQPIDGRDVIELLARAGTSDAADGQSLDIAGPDVLTYGELIDRIREIMLVGRPSLELGLTATPIASRIAAAIASESHELIGPLMAGLETDLLPRDDRAADLLGVRLHSFEAAVERALRDWEAAEPLAAR